VSEPSRVPAHQSPKTSGDDAESPLRVERWTLVRDVLVFQAKMFLEGFRDLLLVPLTLGAGLLGLLFGGERPARLFREVLRLCRRFDGWLDLFGPLRPRAGREPRGRKLDDYVERLERKILEDHERGGPSRSAARALDSALDRLQRRGKSRKSAGD
jgi:hypothetical protein